MNLVKEQKPTPACVDCKFVQVNEFSPNENLPGFKTYTCLRELTPVSTYNPVTGEHEIVSGNGNVFDCEKERAKIELSKLAILTLDRELCGYEGRFFVMKGNEDGRH